MEWERKANLERHRHLSYVLAGSSRYGLGAPSTVAKALSALVAREVLARGGPRYVFDDPFFRRWWPVMGPRNDTDSNTNAASRRRAIPMRRMACFTTGVVLARDSRREPHRRGGRAFR